MPLLGGLAVSLCSTSSYCCATNTSTWCGERAGRTKSELATAVFGYSSHAVRANNARQGPRYEQHCQRRRRPRGFQLEESERLQYVVLDDPPPGYASLHDDVSLPEATPATPERQ